jgi:hypothetical protein
MAKECQGGTDRVMDGWVILGFQVDRACIFNTWD